MKNFLLLVLSVLLLTLTFVITLGTWPVIVFWVSFFVVVFSVVGSAYLAFYFPYWLYDMLISRLLFGKLVSWFAVMSTSIFSYVVTLFLYDTMGKVSVLRDGIWDVSTAGPFVAIIVAAVSVIWGTLYAMQRSIGRK